MDLLANKTAFKIAFVTYASINLIPIINIQFFTRVFLAFFALWGFAVVLYDLFARKLRNYKSIALMVVFLANCLVSYVLSFDHVGLTKIATLAFTSLSVLILFLNDDHSFEQVKKEIYWLNLSFSLVAFCAVLVSLLFFALNVHFEIIGRIGTPVRFGFLENRLFGVFSSSNIGGSYAFASIGMVLINLLYMGKTHSKAMTRYYYTNIALCYIYIALSLSRGTYLSVSVAIVVASLLLKLPQRFLDLFHGKKILARIGCILLCIFLFFGSMDGIKKVFSFVPISVYYVEATVMRIFIPGWVGNEPEIIDFVRIEEGSDDVTNGRTDIWLSELNLLKQDIRHILFGVGSSAVDPEDTAFIEKNNISEHDVAVLDRFNGNSHNGYLQIWVECGIFALLLFLAFLIMCFIKWLKSWNRLQKDPALWKLSVMLLAFVAYFLANNMVETNFMLMGTNTFQCLFWVYAGYLYYVITMPQKPEEMPI